MTKLLFYPSGTKDLPSSHLRVYETALELEKKGYTCTIVDPTLPDESKKVYLDLAEPGTIVYIQKIAQPFHKPASFLPYKDKFRLVYDVDDYHEGQDDLMIQCVNQVIAGSHYVMNYCLQHNPNVTLLCSITDTDIYKYVDRADKKKGPLDIIWTESFANAYLEDLILIQAPMRKMYEKHNVRFTLQGLRENRNIGNKRYWNLIPKFIQMFPYCIIQKFMTIEQFLIKGVQTVQSADIGTIPFKTDRVGKAAQNMRSLMSVGLGCIGTPGNEHEYVIEHGVTGFLASTEKEWEEALETLITNRELRLEMGRKASEHIAKTYGREQYVSGLIKALNL